MPRPLSAFIGREVDLERSAGGLFPVGHGQLADAAGEAHGEFADGCGVPENQLLSHDLFESTFASAALVSDIELFDGWVSGETIHAPQATNA